MGGLRSALSLFGDVLAFRRVVWQSGDPLRIRNSDCNSHSPSPIMPLVRGGEGATYAR